MNIRFVSMGTHLVVKCPCGWHLITPEVTGDTFMVTLAEVAAEAHVTTATHEDAHRPYAEAVTTYEPQATEA